MPAFAAPVSPATTPSGSLGMLVGAGGMHATSLLVVSAGLAAAVLDPPLVVLSDPLLPQAASTTIDRAAAPMGRHLLQVRISAPPLSLVTHYCATGTRPCPRSLAGWADPAERSRHDERILTEEACQVGSSDDPRIPQAAPRRGRLGPYSWL